MHKCKVCGYLYDSTIGDPINGIEPETLFNQLPPEWKCPVCGVTKDDFIELE